MSYQVLARKWRPRRFSELVGQEHVVTAISNALDNDRLHHAYLFTGTRGVGKTTIARIFSKSLNCEQGQGANPCGQCDTCREIEQGNYVDLLEIDAASRTKVEDTRELLDNVQYRPTRGRYKVYLIDEVHMLSKHSFNALLKTLEEPPPHVKFLLATTDPQKLPITILSRCLQFNLKALSREQITHQLQHILNAEQVSFEAPALSLLARAAQGSMRDALSLTDQAIAQGDNQVNTAIVTDMLGLMDRHQLLKLLHAVVKNQPEQVMAIVGQMAEQAPDFGQVLAELSSLLHQIALTQWVPDACKLETTSAKAIYQLAKAIPAEHVQLYYQIVLNGRKDLPFASDGRSGLEMTLLRMMSFTPATPLSDPEGEISQGQPGLKEPVFNTAPAATIAKSEAVADETVQEPEQALQDEQTEIENQAAQYRAQSASLQSEPVQQAEPSQLQPVAEDGPPDWHQYEPVDDVPYNAQSDQEDAPPPDWHEPEPEQHIENPESSLSSTQDMLALRQRLKRAREEANESGVKKSKPASQEAVFPARNISSTSSQSSLSPSPTPELSPEPNLSPELVEGQEDTPPWDIAPSTSLGSSLSPSPESNLSPELVEGCSSVPVPDPAKSVEKLDLQSLPAYLDNGEKLTAASQIDTWSALVERMPVAGLLKQLALHAAFSRTGNTVTLHIDKSQAHLLNDSAQTQLSQALCEGLGEQVEMQVALGEPDETPFATQQKINAMRQRYAEHVVESDQTIQSIVSAFNASVVADTIKAR